MYLKSSSYSIYTQHFLKGNNNINKDGPTKINTQRKKDQRSWARPNCVPLLIVHNEQLKVFIRGAHSGQVQNHH